MLDLLISAWLAFRQNHFGMEPSFIVMSNENWAKLIEEEMKDGSGNLYTNHQTSNPRFRGVSVYRSSDIGNHEIKIG
jgi:hypothetical protein